MWLYIVMKHFIYIDPYVPLEWREPGVWVLLPFTLKTLRLREATGCPRSCNVHVAKSSFAARSPGFVPGPLPSGALCGLKTSAPFSWYSVSGHSLHGHGEICLVSTGLAHKWEHTVVLDIWKMSLKLPGPQGPLWTVGETNGEEIWETHSCLLYHVFHCQHYWHLSPDLIFMEILEVFFIIKSDTFYFHRLAFQRFSAFWFIIFP